MKKINTSKTLIVSLFVLLGVDAAAGAVVGAALPLAATSRMTVRAQATSASGRTQTAELLNSNTGKPDDAAGVVPPAGKKAYGRSSEQTVSGDPLYPDNGFSRTTTAAAAMAQSDQDLANQEQERINRTSPDPGFAYYFDQTEPEVPETSTTGDLSKYGIRFAPDSDYTYKYKVDEVRSNGINTLFIKVYKGGTESTNANPIQFIAYKTNWTAISNEIASLTASSKTQSDFTAASGSNQPLSSLETQLGLNAAHLIDLAKDSLPVLWSKSAGNQVVTFKQFKNDKSTAESDKLNEKSVTPASFYKTEQELANDEQARINNLPLTPGFKYYFDASAPAVPETATTTGSLPAYGITFTPASGYAYKYDVAAVSASGSLAVMIRVSKGQIASTNAAAIQVPAVKTNWTEIAKKIAALTASSKRQPLEKC